MSRFAPTEYHGEGAVQKARHNARYGGREWIAYVDKSGTEHAFVKSTEGWKAAMLGVGTQGYILIFGGERYGQMITGWRLMTQIFRNIRKGYL